MRRAEGHPERGRSLRGTVAYAPVHAAGAGAGRTRGIMARLRMARASVMACQDVGRVGRVMRCRGMGRSQGQPPEQQTRQAQGEDPASEVKGSVYRHWAALTLSRTHKPVPIARVVAGFTSCSPQPG
jgi:hypothetical protein